MTFQQPITPIPLDTTYYSHDPEKNESREPRAVFDLSQQVSQLTPGTTTVERKIPGFLSAHNDPLSLFLLVAVISIILPEVHTKQKIGSLNDIYRSIEQTISKYEIHDMLIAVSPYLDTPEQEAVYSIIGMLEVIYILKGISDGSYQIYRMQQTPVPARHDDKGLGIIKALSDYIPENRRTAVEKTIQIYESLERLGNNYKIYSNNLELSDGEKPNPIEQMNEIIKIIKPIIPQQQQNRIERMQKLLQIAQVMDFSEAIKGNGSDMDTAEHNVREDPNHHANKEKSGEDIINDGTTQYEKNLAYDEAKGKSNDSNRESPDSQNQDQSLEMILRLLKLLSQASD